MTTTTLRATTRALAVGALTLVLAAPALCAQDSSTVHTAATAPYTDSASGDVSETPSVWNLHRVRGIDGEGGTIRLADGTKWDVYLPDRPTVDRWHAGDVVVVRTRNIKVSTGTGNPFDYLLINGRDNSTATVRFAGMQQPGLSGDAQ